MRHLITVLVLLLTASFAAAEKPDASKDTVTLRWKGVSKVGDQYCRWVGGAKFCIDAKDVISVKEDGKYTIIVMRKKETEVKSYPGNAWSSSSSSSSSGTVVRKKT
jgi:hypothetical protein